jgi:hypothetical protein
MVAFCIEQITAHVWVPTVDTNQRPVRVQREDEDGQIVINTNLRETTEQKLVSMDEE